MLTELVSKGRNTPSKDPIYNREVQKLKDKDMMASFENPLVFGTAGMRGLMGFGPNKINEFTIKSASYAYAQYLLKNVENSAKMGVVIAHDNRHNSTFFAEISARVLKAVGIKVFLYEHNELQPTPLVSYTIRRLKLAGGIIITASHNPKQYNGFKVYNTLGAQLMPSETKIIQKFMQDLDPLTIKIDDGNLSYVNNEIINDYIKAVLKVRLRPNDQKMLSVVFSPQHGTSAKIGPKLLSLMDIEHYNVAKQMQPNPDFKYTKTPNPEDGKSFNRGESLARKKKSDLIIVTDPDADRLGVAVKYKKRYKYLNGNELAALYLEYLINELIKNGQMPQNAYIVKTVVSGKLAEAIVKRHNVKVYETHVGFKNIAQLIENKKTSGETFLFAYEESFGFLLNPDIARDKDALQAMVGTVEMANFYKTQDTNLYSQLELLGKKYGIHRSIVQGKQLSLQAQENLLQKISKVKRVGKQKVLRIEDYRLGYNQLEPQNLVKVVLKNGSWFAIRPSGTEPKVKLYIQSIGKTSDDLIDVVMFEKVIENLVENNTEVEGKPNIKIKDIVKYTICFLIIIAALLIVFQFVYKGFAGKSVLDIALQIFNSQARIIWFGFIVGTFFTILLDAWIKKRLLRLQGEKVAIHYLLISSFMGQIISFVTPLAIGGDAIVYGYLRKKGVKRAPLLSTLVSSLILYQARIVIQTLILLPIGFPLYSEFLNSGSTETQVSLIGFIIGLTGNSFATTMIFLLALSRPFQEGIIIKSITFLEGLPFYHIYDPGIIFARVQYEFSEMRNGMRSLGKTWGVIFEMLFYFLLPVFFNPAALILSLGGFVNYDLPRGPYGSQIVANDIIGTSNSLSITPGGSGTGEGLTVTVNQRLYEGSQFQIKTGMTPDSIASGIDLNGKLIQNGPNLIFSALLTANIIIGEGRINKYKIINKNLKLTGQKIGRNTRIYYYTAIPGILILVTGIVLIFTLPT